MRNLLFIGALCAVLGAQSPTSQHAASATVETWFSPHGGCEARILVALASARQTLCVEVYTANNARLGNAIAQARARGVTVAVIQDADEWKHDPRWLNALRASGCRTYVDNVHKIMHDKVAIIDDSQVITGSYNWSNAAEATNAENLVVITSKEATAQYRANFELLRTQSHEQ